VGGLTKILKIRTLKQLLKFRFFGVLAVSLIAGLCLTIGLLNSNSSEAASYDYVNFQGKLTDASGFGVASQTKTIRFSIFDDATLDPYVTSCTGHCKWTETQSVTTDARGIFSVQVGSSNPTGFKALFSTYSDIYLGVKVDTDAEMTPRHPVGSVPSALNSQTLLGNTWAVPGAIGSTTPNSGAFTTVSASTSVSTNSLTTTSGNDISLNVKNLTNLGTLSSGALQLITTGANSLTFSTNNTQIGRFDSAGNFESTGSINFYTTSNGDITLSPNGTGKVGVGTTSPAEKLDVNGVVRLQQTTAPSTVTDKLYNVSGNLYWNGSSLLSSTDTNNSIVNNFVPNSRFLDGQNGWTGWGTSNPGVTDSIINTQAGLTIDTWDESAWTTSNTYAYLVDTGIDYSDPYLVGKYIVFTGSPTAALANYNLKIVAVDQANNRVRVYLPIGWQNLKGYPAQPQTGENYTIAAIASRSTKAVKCENLFNGCINSNYFTIPGNQAISGSYEVLVTNSPSNKNFYLQIEVYDSNGKAVYRWGGPSLVTGNTNNWQVVKWGPLGPFADTANWSAGAEVGAKSTPTYQARVILKPYDDTYASKVYLTGVQINGGSIPYAYNPHYIETEDANARLVNNLSVGGNVGIGGTTPTTTGRLQITDATTTASYSGIRVDQSGAVSGTGYAGYFAKTGTSTTNVGLYATASGATNNYAAIFDQGNVGVGNTTPGTRKLNISTSNSTNDVGLESTISRTTGANYGIRALANGSGATTNYGLYATASGATNNYAAIFDQGNVGIGTTAPSYTLMVVAPASFANWATTIFGGTTTGSSWGLLVDAGTNSSDAAMQIRKSDNTNIMYIRGDGNVGIGTASPTNILDIQKNDAGSHANRPIVSIYNTATGGGYGKRSELQLQGVNGSDVLKTASILFEGGTSLSLSADGAPILLNSSSGNVGIGVTSPTGVLHLKAGTTAASTAPLKFTSGTNMTAAEAGAVEWDGTNLFITQTSGPTRKTIAYTDSAIVGSLPWNNLINPTGNMALSTMGSYTSTFTYGATTSTNNLFNLTDTASNTGTGYMLNVTTATGSTLKPFHVSAAGVEAITVLADGNVGIGTTGPGQKLDIYAGDNFGLAVRSSAGATRINLTAGGATNWWQFPYVSSNNNIFIEPEAAEGDVIFRNLANKDVLNIDNSVSSIYIPNGNVGIGTTSPTGKLDIVGSQNFSAMSAPIALTAGTPTSGGSCTAGTHSYKVTFTSVGGGETTGGTTSNQITCVLTTGQTVPLTAIPIGPAGTTGRKVYRTVAGDTGSYLFLTTISDNTTTTYSDTTADGSLGVAAPGSNTTAVANIQTGGTTKMVINSSGLVGIGNTAPDTLLTVGSASAGSDSKRIMSNLVSNNTSPNLINSYIYTISSGNRSSTYGTYGLYNEFRLTGNTSSTYTVGGANIAWAYNGSSHGQLTGGQNKVSVSGGGGAAGTVTLGIGLDNYLETGTVSGGAGTITTGIGERLAVSGEGTVGTYYALKVEDLPSAITSTTAYGLYLGNLTKATTSYGVYQSNPGDENYFAGNVGIGTTSPTGRLHSYISNAAVTASQYAGYYENLATNSTTDGINKYGMYITSTGSFTGSTGTATNNYGLYVNTPTGADNNYSIYSAGGANYFGGDIQTGGLVTEKTVTFTPTTVGWYRIVSSTGMAGGTIRIKGAYDNRQTDVELQFNVSGYGITGSIQETRYSAYNQGVVSKARTSAGAGGNIYLDIYVATATTPGPITLYGYGPSMPSFVAAPTVGAVEAYSNVNVLTFGHGLRTTGGLDIIGNQNFSALDAPGALTAGTPTAGGSCTPGTHSYVVTYVTVAGGETTAGTASSQITCVLTTGQTVPLSNIPRGPSAVTARKIYRTVAGDTGSYLLLTTLNDNSTSTYSDTTDDASLGVAAPGSNTSAVANFQTGGTNRLTINSLGNVGIGTNNPQPSVVGRRVIYLYQNGSGAEYIADDGTVRAKYFTNASVAGIATISNSPVTISVNSSEKLRVDTTGNVGIGVTVPTGKLHLAAGTTSASTAPLKFTAGTNMTTAEAGAVEWDGSRLYITQTTGPTRKTLAYTDDAASIGIGSSITSATPGSVLYAGALGVLAQGNSNFYYDYTNARLGLGTTSPQGIFEARTSTDNNLLVRGPIDLATGVSIFSVNDANNALRPMEMVASQFYIDGGNVGIGTLNPTTKLDVNGNGRISDTFYVNNGTYLNSTSSSNPLTINKNLMSNITAAWSAGAADTGNARDGQVSTVYKNKMYIFGGYNSSSLDTMRIYDFSTSTWSAGVADTGNFRNSASAVVFNNKMYVFGGYDGSSYLDTMRIYDFETGSWSAGTSDTGNVRQGHSAVVYNGKMYVYGGYTGSTYLDTMRVYDFAAGTWAAGTADTGNTKYEHSAVVYNNKMYVFGGMNGTYLDTMRIYDFAANSWSGGTADASILRAFHSAEVYNNKMYVYGGYNGSAALNTLRIYDLAAGSWSAGTADTGNDKYYHTSVVYNNKMYIFGGYNGSYYDTMRIFDFGDGQSILSLQENGIGTLSFKTDSTVNLDSGYLKITNGDITLTGTIIGNGVHTTASTMVGGLNADYLDGYDASAFGDATAANQTTILSRIGTNSDAASMSDTLFAGQQYIWDNRASFGNTPYVYKNDGTTSLGKFLGFNGGGIACTNMVYSNASSDPYQLTAADCDTSTYNGTGKDVYYSVGACGGTMYISSTGNNATTIYKRYGGTYIVTDATASSHTYGSYRHYADSTCHTSSSSMTSYTVTDYTFGACGVDGSSTGACKVK